jgi:hypothetical protein
MFKINGCLLIACFVISIFSACNNEPGSKTTAEKDSTATAVAYDWALLPFIKVDSLNPVLTPGNGEFVCPVLKQKIKWEAKDVFNPAMVVKNGKVYMLYRAEDSIGKYAGTSRIGFAESTDGLHFKRYPTPVLFPDNDAQKKYEYPGGCEDPRIVQDSNRHLLYDLYRL